MDRREAMLRELNLYPQWVRRKQPVPVVTEYPAAVTAEVEAAVSGCCRCSNASGSSDGAAFCPECRPGASPDGKK